MQSKYVLATIVGLCTALMLHEARVSYDAEPIVGLPTLSSPTIVYNAEANTVIVDGAKEWREYVDSSTKVWASKWVVWAVTFGHGRLVHASYDTFERFQREQTRNAITSIKPSSSGKTGSMEVTQRQVSEGHSLKDAAISGEIKWLEAHSSFTTHSSADAYFLQLDGYDRHGYANWLGGYAATASEIATYLVFRNTVMFALGAAIGAYVLKAFQ